MLEKFKTVNKIGEAEVIEKKSRFIATVTPVKDEEQAQQFIESIKKKYWNARHNCYAYQIGERDEIRRFSDDGEPQGTAGKPILDVLIGENLKNTAIVVTRYFGGVLLGTGGLVRAYGKAAKEGVVNAEIIEKNLYKKISIIVDYTLTGKVQYEIMQEGHIIEDTIYTDNVEYIVLCEVLRLEGFIKRIIDITGNKANIVEKDLIYK